MARLNDISTVPSDLPVPADDGACDHLEGTTLPSILLQATDGTHIDLSRFSGRVVVFLYPRTGRPGVPALVDDWNAIPGARGCTPQTCGYRDLAGEFAAEEVAIIGLSSQDTNYQQELAVRLHLPFRLLSDSQLRLTRALSLPTFVVNGHELIRRMAWVLENGKIIKVFYPVFPPDENASYVLNWLRTNPYHP